jgi:hypothetical protein
MAKVDVKEETEAERGWLYRVLVEDDAGQTTQHAVSLSWADHDHWSGGRRPPSRVVEAVLEFVLSHRIPVALPAKFDAARARRWLPEIDAQLRSEL